MNKNVSEMSTAEYFEMRRQNSLRNALIIVILILIVVAWASYNSMMYAI